MLKYKQNRKLIQIVCDNCGQLYDKPITEYNRNIRLKRHNYCCRSCSMKGNKIIKVVILLILFQIIAKMNLLLLDIILEMQRKDLKTLI